MTAGVAESNLAGSIASKMGAGGSTMVRGAIAGVAGNVGSYAARRVIDPKNTHFSWKSVAASAVAGAISAKISSTLTSKIPDKNFRQFADGAIGGVVSLHTRRAFGMNDRVDYAAIAADAFGNALGNAYNARRSERAAYETQAAEQLNDAIWADGNPFNDGAENAEAAKGVKQSDPSGASEGDSAEVDTGHEPVVYGDGYDTYYPNDRPNMHRDASAEAQKASTGSERRARWNQIVASRTELKNLGDDFFDPDSASDEEFDAMVNLYTRDSKNLGEGGMLMSPYHLNSGLLQGSPGQVCAVDGDCLIPGQTFIYDATVKKINGVFAIRLNSPYTDLDKVNEKLGTSVDFSFLGNREGGQYLDSYVPYNGKPGNNSGVTLATGVDMSQQNSSVLLRSGVPADLVDRLSVAIPFTKQHAVDWNVTNQIHVSPAEAALLDESVAYRYTDEIKSYWDKKRLNSSPDFVDLTSAQQTVLLSRYFNSGFGQLGKHAFFQNAIKGDWSAAAAALRTIDNPSIHDRLMKEANLIDPSP